VWHRLLFLVCWEATSGVKSEVLCRSSSVLLRTHGALVGLSKSRQQLDRCLAATVWAARQHSYMHHWLSLLAAWKPDQCTSAWRHRLKLTGRYIVIRNQWGVSMGWNAIWLKCGQQPPGLHWSSDWSTARCVSQTQKQTLNICYDVFLRNCYDF